MKQIKRCRVCKSKNIVDFLDLGDQPFANSLLKSPSEPENLYPLSLSWCSDCNLVQLNYTADPKELFSNYVWVTSTSNTAKVHSTIFYEEIISRTKDLDNNYVLEIASNDGTFLLPFVQNGHSVLGVDPAKNIVNIAIAKGVPTICKFFGVNEAEEIVQEFGHAKIVVARNVLPHVANLHEIVEGLHTCIQDEGLLVVEFHYAKVIFEGLHYDSIYHEHLCYFTLKSIENLFNQYNLFIFDLKESPISGGSLILYLKKGKVEETQIVQSYRNHEKEIAVNELQSWKDFAERTYNHREQLLDIFNNVIEKKGQIIGYGASARSSTLLNFCGIDNKFISIIADQNDIKHKYYTAGTHILIDSPEEALKKNPDHVLILAWNFTDEIMGILRNDFNFKGKCILPLPNNPKIIDVCE